MIQPRQQQYAGTLTGKAAFVVIEVMCSGR